MERTIISWNVANWVTVILMAAAGYAVLAVLASVIKPAPQTAQTGGV
jgi:hypothetical protein